MNLTPKQLEVIDLIQRWRCEKGVSPTMQEIAAELGVSKVTIFERIEALIRKGALNREPNKARSLSIVENDLFEQTGGLRFPLVGRIAAGMPIERCEDQDALNLNEMFGPRIGVQTETFALQVEGDSMKDDGIMNGDYVLIQKQQTARNGERVVALLPDGETTLKTFYKESNGTFRLQPANDDFEPIIVNECNIQGIVTAVLRSY